MSVIIKGLIPFYHFFETVLSHPDPFPLETNQDNTLNFKMVRVLKRKKLLRRFAQGAYQNVSFNDMQKLVESFGFRFVRREGSHHIYTHPGIKELVNMQEVSGEAKPYQIRQFLKLIEKYNLKVEDES